MAVLYNVILLFTTILPTRIPLAISQKNNGPALTIERPKEENCLELPLESLQPVLLIRKPVASQKKEWVASAGTIFGHNPYFCNTFAFTQLSYIPVLPMQCDLFCPLISFRYLLADKKEYGFSIGGGGRYYSVPLCAIVGFNLFYDFRSIPCNHYYEIGLGWEYLHFLSSISLLEVRTNVYFPLNRHFIVKAKYCYYPEKYIAIGTNKFCSPGGLEVELGKRFFYKNLFDLYFSIAPYYLFNQEYGVQYNGIFRWKSIAYVGIQFYQSISCSIVDIAGIIGISIPLGSNNICEKNMPLRIPIFRWETIKLRSCTTWKTNY